MSFLLCQKLLNRLGGTMYKRTLFILLLLLATGALASEDAHIYNFRLEENDKLSPLNKKLLSAIEVHDFVTAQKAIDEGADINSSFVRYETISLIDVAITAKDDELFNFLLINGISMRVNHYAGIIVLSDYDLVVFARILLKKAHETDVQKFIEYVMTCSYSKRNSWSLNILRLIFLNMPYSNRISYAQYKQDCLLNAVENVYEEKIKLALFYGADTSEVINTEAFSKFAKENSHLNLINLLQSKDPVSKYPAAFETEWQFSRSEKLKEIQETSGSVCKYLERRELGIK